METELENILFWHFLASTPISHWWSGDNSSWNVYLIFYKSRNVIQYLFFCMFPTLRGKPQFGKLHIFFNTFPNYPFYKVQTFTWTRLRDKVFSHLSTKNLKCIEIIVYTIGSTYFPKIGLARNILAECRKICKYEIKYLPNSYCFSSWHQFSIIGIIVHLRQEHENHQDEEGWCEDNFSAGAKMFSLCSKFNLKLISVVSLSIKECQDFYKMRQIELNISLRHLGQLC